MDESSDFLEEIVADRSVKNPAFAEMVDAAAQPKGIAKWIDWPWRTGRKNPHTIYAQLGNHPSDDDPFLGSLNDPIFTKRAVEDHNWAYAEHWHKTRAADAKRYAELRKEEKVS
jgi:hypothetical protein